MRFNFVVRITFFLVFAFVTHISIAAKPSSTTTLGSSPNALDVTINEVSVSSSYVELYFHQTTDITGWALAYEGQGNISGFVEICNATISSNPAASSCGTYPAGTFLLISNLSMHNTLQELLLVDNNTNPPSGNVAVHYFRYANKSHQASGDFAWETSDPATSTIYYETGKKGNLCAKPDGTTDVNNLWGECNETPNDTNEEPVLHHFQIVHDGQGLTCQAETVTINACANADCSVKLTESVSLELTGNGVVKATPTFTGSTTVSFNHTVAENLTLSIANASVAPTNSIECVNGASSSCVMVFANAGFRFLYGASESTTIADQTAAVTFPGELKIQAVENTNGVCTGLFSGDVTVDLAQENVIPTLAFNPGLSFTINGGAINKYPTYTPTTLNFGADSKATIPSPMYLDAGQIRLQANYTDGSISLSGASNSFWVSPSSIVLTENTGATHAAGEDFTLTATAVNFLGDVTPNYQPGNIQLRLERTGPTAFGVDGSLNYGAGTMNSALAPAFDNAPMTFTSGVSSNTSYYSEVGNINLDLQDSNYGSGITINANAIDIGRFIPHHFEQTVPTHGAFDSLCTAGLNNFAYIGQMDEATSSVGAISYSTNPVLSILAHNKQHGITQNYNEGGGQDFMRLESAGVVISPPTKDVAQLQVGSLTEKLDIISVINTGNLTIDAGGQLTYTLSGSDHFVYQRSALAQVAPFTSDIDFVVASITDADGVNVTSTETISPTGINVRFGRQVIENSFGPETVDLPQPMRIEHFDGANYVLSTENSCAGYDSSKVSLTNISLNPALTAVLGGTGNFTNGESSNLRLQAPGAGNQGQLGVTYDAFPWFEFDWDGNGSYTNDPTAVATFGVYRGNDRIIYHREITK